MNTLSQGAITAMKEQKKVSNPVLQVEDLKILSQRSGKWTAF